MVMGVVPSLMGNVCVYVCMYVVDCPKRQGEAMNTGRQSPRVCPMGFGRVSSQ